MTKRSEDIVKAELERKSRDLYKVFNPTNQDFIVELNKAVSPELWTIHANTEEIVPMYVAVKYAEEMGDKIIYNKSDSAVIEENDKRLAKGFNKMDVHTEQARFESQRLKSMMSKRDKLQAVLIKGLYKEYGLPSETPQNPDRSNFEVDSSVDTLLGVPSRPQAVKVAVEPIVEPQPEVGIVEKTPYEKKLDNLAKAREAKKVKNEAN